MATRKQTWLSELCKSIILFVAGIVLVAKGYGDVAAREGRMIFAAGLLACATSVIFLAVTYLSYNLLKEIRKTIVAIDKFEEENPEYAPECEEFRKQIFRMI